MFTLMAVQYNSRHSYPRHIGILIPRFVHKAMVAQIEHDEDEAARKRTRNRQGWGHCSVGVGWSSVVHCSVGVGYGLGEPVRKVHELTDAQ